MGKVLGLVGSEDLCDKRLLYSKVDPDNSLGPWKFLLERISSCGISPVYYKNIRESTKPYGYLFMNYDGAVYRKVHKRDPSAKKFLMVFESEVVMPENWSPVTYSKFDVILTWDEDIQLHPREKFVHFFWPHSLPYSVQTQPFTSRKKDFVMVVSDKRKKHPLELYTERLHTIDWFIKNSPENFDLYGWGWDYGAMVRLKKHIRNIPRYLRGEFPLPVDVSPVYRGAINSKIQALSKYKFCFCYENARDIPGYITEKILDCFAAGVIPIYWGWGGVSKYIPEACFINRRDFQSMESLVQRLTHFTGEEYNAYMSHIMDFLESDSADRFRAEYFADVVTGGLMGEGKMD
ncbi:MAG: hypothetical protein CSA35_02860 [Dethiosulfovibrio peptidovorans]|nr:MAG: hypothetical protein CSA35_02860 [Dethiosulfovibrio peptidovorans]